MDAPTPGAPLPAERPGRLDPELERLSAELLAMLPDNLPEPAPTHGPYSDLPAGDSDELAEGIAAIFRGLADAGAADEAGPRPEADDEPTRVLLGELDRPWARPAP